MKNWILLLLCSYLLPIYSNGQMVTVSEDLSIRNDRAYDLIGRMKDRILLYREKSSNKVVIQAYDDRLRLSWDKELDFDHKKAEVIAMVPDRDQFSLIYKYKKKGTFYLKIHKYDPGANLVDSTTIISFRHRFLTPNYQAIYSQDKSKILLFNIEKQTNVTAMAFDTKSMGVIWSSNFTLQDPSFYNNHMEVIISNQGGMYFIIAQNNRKAKRADHFYEIFHCRGGLSEIQRLSVPMEGKLSFDMVFEFDNLNRKLVAGGLYSEKSLSKANGYFTLSIPLNAPQDYLLKFQSFDDAFISDLEGKKINDNKGINDIEVREIVLRQDGGMLLIFEKTKLYERRLSNTSRVYSNSGYTVDYYHDNLSVISVHPDGNNHWKTVLYKKQYSQDDNAIFSSYFLLKTPSSLRLLFNDEIRFENTVSEYVLKGNGEYDRNSVLSTEDQDIRLRFQDALQIGAREVLVPSERRNRLRLVKVTY